jgi:prolipoprotein diacylglyceryltransferase
VPIAAILVALDPLLRLADGLVVRWQTIALAAIIVAALSLAARIGRWLDLRADDLLYIAVGIVPGAVVGGRLAYGLIHVDTFGAAPGLLLDPSRPGLELGGAVVGGILTAAAVAGLLGAPIGRWAHAGAFALLFALGEGKLAMLLGGAGQGLPSDAPWATAYLGPGPWGSLAPDVPSHPSQAYEGLATLALLIVLATGVIAGAFARHDGRLLLAAVAGWALIRAAVSLTWRDPPVVAAGVVGPFGAGGLLALAIAGVTIVALVIASWRARGAGVAPSVDESGPLWPDPSTRPRF